MRNHGGTCVIVAGHQFNDNNWRLSVAAAFFRNFFACPNSSLLVYIILNLSLIGFRFFVEEAPEKQAQNQLLVRYECKYTLLSITMLVAAGAHSH